jgi:hypothetical protein
MKICNNFQTVRTEAGLRSKEGSLFAVRPDDQIVNEGSSKV